MAKVSEIIKDIKGGSQIKRIEYPYNSNTAVEVWKGIAAKYVGDVIINKDVF